MEVAVLERQGVRIIEWLEPIARVDDALNLVSTCIEHGSTRLLLDSTRLPAAFFDLRSRFAGEFLQKLENYRMRLAAVFPTDEDHGERFSEFLTETKRGRSFRVFSARAEAEAWLAAK